MIDLKIQLVDSRAVAPSYSKIEDACLDLKVIVDEGEYSMPPHSVKMFDTGIIFDIPKNYSMRVYARSGLSCKHRVSLANDVGIIDSGFTDTVKVVLTNDSDFPYVVRSGDRVAQFEIVPKYTVNVIVVDSVEKTDRGVGFGSSGR